MLARHEFSPITGSARSLDPPGHWIRPVTGSARSLDPPGHWIRPATDQAESVAGNGEAALRSGVRTGLRDAERPL
jgi:hypothetical protein